MTEREPDARHFGTVHRVVSCPGVPRTVPVIALESPNAGKSQSQAVHDSRSPYHYMQTVKCEVETHTVLRLEIPLTESTASYN